MSSIDYSDAVMDGRGIFALGVRNCDSLWGWGYNYFGQLGLGNTTTPITDPSQAGTDTNWLSIVCGYYHTMGIRTNGTLWGWGANSDGQLGLGNTTSPITNPSQVGTDTYWLSIWGGGYHTMGIRTNGTLWGWGDNSYGALGLGVQGTDILDPSQVGTDTDWLSIGASVLYTMGIRTNGTLWGWGYNYYGQLGLGTDGENTHVVDPSQVGTDTDWLSIVCGEMHTMGIRTNGTLWGWGRNQSGQLGLGNTTSPINNPSQVGTDTDWLSIACGQYHTMAIRTNNTLWGLGHNGYGQLGLGNTTSPITNPSQVGTDTDWAKIICLNFTTLAIKSNGSVWGWGQNGYGQCCLGFTGNPVLVPTQSPIWTWDDCPPPPPPPIPKNLQIKWNSVKNSKYIRFPYESAFNGLKEQISFVEYTDGYHKKINIEKTQDPTK